MSLWTWIKENIFNDPPLVTHHSRRPSYNRRPGRFAQEAAKRANRRLQRGRKAGVAKKK